MSPPPKVKLTTGPYWNTQMYEMNKRFFVIYKEYNPAVINNKPIDQKKHKQIGINKSIQYINILKIRSPLGNHLLMEVFQLRKPKWKPKCVSISLLSNTLLRYTNTHMKKCNPKNIVLIFLLSSCGTQSHTLDPFLKSILSSQTCGIHILVWTLI